MLWRKRKANPQSVLGIVALATPFSYKVHDVLMSNDKESGFFRDKGESLFKHVMAAATMIAIIDLEDDYYPLYYSEIVDGLERHYSGLEHLCSDFNEYVRRNYHVNTRLDSIVLQWLHERVGTGDTSNQAEIEMLAGAVKAIFIVYYDWFNKNNMPIKC